MSITEVSVEPQTAASTQEPLKPAGGPLRWVRVAVAVGLLAASGGIRWWQASGVQARLRDARHSPFPLKDLPMTIGDWRGETTVIDPKIARNTGASEIVTRKYVDQRTGAAIEAIFLYGPTTEVYGHVPERCYPNAGFEQVAGPDVRKVRLNGREVPFRVLVYSKGEGGQANLEEVYYSWRYNGQWTPEVASTYKRLERIPGMFKVHLARLVTDRERRDVGNPCEAFLEQFLPELERRLALSLKPSPAAPGRPAEGRAQ